MRIGSFIATAFASLSIVTAEAASSSSSSADESIQSIQLFIRTVSDHSIENIGAIEYHKDKKKGQFVNLSGKEVTLNKDTDYCFGTQDLANHDCFAYVSGNDESLSNKNFHVFLNGANVIDHISINNEVSDKTEVIVHGVIRSPIPNLRAEATKNQQSQQQQASPKTEKVIQKKKVKYIDEDGNEQEREVEEEVEVEVDDRSFIQKNWMYIVPTLLLFVLMSDDKKG